jgi:hypothetical protein
VIDVGTQLQLDWRLSAINTGDGDARTRRIRAHGELAVRQAQLDQAERQRLVRFDLDIGRPGLEALQAQLDRMRARHDLRLQRRDAARHAVDEQLRARRLGRHAHDAPARHQLRLERLRLA